jgi:hypothetical protein
MFMESFESRKQEAEGRSQIAEKQKAENREFSFCNYNL